MASSNPVFSQVNRQIEQGYAGFGQQRAGQQPGPGFNPAGMQGVQDRDDQRPAGADVRRSAGRARSRPVG